MVEEHALPTDPPYRTAGGTTVDLVIQDEYMMAHVCHYIMAHIADSLYYTKALKKQYGLKAGLDRGSVAVLKELMQFHTLKCFQPCDLSTLTRDDCHNALTSLMFLTKKDLEKLRHLHAPMAVPNNLTLLKRKRLHCR